jgi:hypothetical protein
VALSLRDARPTAAAAAAALLLRCRHLPRRGLRP